MTVFIHRYVTAAFRGILVITINPKQEKQPSCFFAIMHQGVHEQWDRLSVAPPSHHDRAVAIVTCWPGGYGRIQTSSYDTAALFFLPQPPGGYTFQVRATI